MDSQKYNQLYKASMLLGLVSTGIGLWLYFKKQKSEAIRSEDTPQFGNKEMGKARVKQ